MSAAAGNGARLSSLAGALVAGLIFGVGLIVAGMSNPAKVLAFLDLAGDWDPSLALVMVGGIAVTRIGLLLGRRARRSASGAPFHASGHRPVDRRLIVGSALFGIGWGLAGFCPGPAVVAVGYGYLPALPLVAGMLLGLWLQRPGRDRR
ncbi:DUF6691 family protein [Zoogloea sp.]|uniref:DUF6691 family protein n=1 Tax=Zoogloea sp. TaxID=49181 RepID=UPI0035AF74F1